jgi:hypothetical protein
MGLGDCISEQAEQAHIRGEAARERWEFENYPEGERKEMVDIYVEKGLSQEDAARLVNLLSGRPEYANFFVEHMLTHELGLAVPDEGDNPIKDGGVTFLSFMFWGSIPLWAYVIFYGANYHHQGGQFGICIAVTVLCLFGLGMMQAHSEFARARDGGGGVGRWGRPHWIRLLCPFSPHAGTTATPQTAVATWQERMPLRGEPRLSHQLPTRLLNAPHASPSPSPTPPGPSPAPRPLLRSPPAEQGASGLPHDPERWPRRGGGLPGWLGAPGGGRWRLQLP